MIYEDVLKIYGPYRIKNRLFIKLKNKSNKIKFMSYPRYVMEKHLNRYLSIDEQVHHIDGNPLNNELSNLQIVLFKEHQKNDVLRNKDLKVTCKYCNKEFIIQGRKIKNHNRTDRHQSGYFCSKTCSGKYGREIQLGLRKHSKEDVILPEKYRVGSAQKEIFDVEVG